MELVTVYTAFSPADAQLIRSRLEAADILVYVTHELSALSMEGYSVSTGGIDVQVPADQAKKAREIIQSASQNSGENPDE